MRNQKGFTMIELVVVIVILGILAAIAIPRFVDMSTEARQAATDGVAAAVASSSAINYAASLAKGQVAGAPLSTADSDADYATDGEIIDTTAGCDDTVAGNLVPDTTFGATGEYQIATVTAFAAGALVGDTLTCTLENVEDSNITSDFTLYATK